jgi:hypothetical protein
VTDTRSVWHRTGARTIALGVTLALATVPLAAAEAAPQTPPAVNLKAAVQKAASTERLSTTTSPQASQPAGTPDLQSPSFFKTPLGLAVIAVVGAGSAYAIYSAQHDRIHSTAR